MRGSVQKSRPAGGKENEVRTVVNGRNECPNEPHRVERLYEQIKMNIVGSGCTPEEAAGILESLRAVCIGVLKQQKNTPHP